MKGVLHRQAFRVAWAFRFGVAAVLSGCLRLLKDLLNEVLRKRLKVNPMSS